MLQVYSDNLVVAANAVFPFNNVVVDKGCGEAFPEGKKNAGYVPVTDSMPYVPVSGVKEDYTEKELDYR